MKKALRIAALFIVAGIAAILGLAAMQPDSFRFERSATIDAPPEKIYAVLSDFRRGAEWSPFEETDPDMKRTFSGAKTGKGAVYEWDGNSEAGAGRLEIVEAVEPSKLKLTLDFSRPFEAHHFVEYTLAPRDGATEVTWSTYGPSPFLSRIMCLFFDPEEMVGGMLEKGLANLKSLAEAEATAKMQ